MRRLQVLVIALLLTTVCAVGLADVVEVSTLAELKGAIVEGKLKETR